MPSQELYLQREQNSFRVDVKYDYEASMNGQVLIGNYLDAHSNQGMETVSVVPSLNEEGQVVNYPWKIVLQLYYLFSNAKLFSTRFSSL